MKKMATQKTPPWFQSLTKSHTPNIVTVHVVIDLALLVDLDLVPVYTAHSSPPS